MTSKADMLAAVAKMRRDQPRNPLAMQLCDSLETLIKQSDRQPLTRAQIQKNYRLRKKGKA